MDKDVETVSETLNAQYRGGSGHAPPQDAFARIQSRLSAYEELEKAAREVLRAHEAEHVLVRIECPRGSISLEAWNRAVSQYGDVLDPRNVTLGRSKAMVRAVRDARQALQTLQETEGES